MIDSPGFFRPGRATRHGDTRHQVAIQELGPNIRDTLVQAGLAE
jgi:hypothetical protein